jgi:4-carboxymuconolactone decarboxylase
MPRYVQCEAKVVPIHRALPNTENQIPLTSILGTRAGDYHLRRRSERMENERFKRGSARLAEIDGEAGERVIASLGGVAPDLARYIVEFGFGDIYSRPGLDLKTRELATVAALVAMGTAEPQLKIHIGGALNVGATKDEIVEIVIQMALYAGFPAAINGVAALREVLSARVD